MSARTLAVTHDPERGCEKCIFWAWAQDLCRWSRRYTFELGQDDTAAKCAPSWCPFRKAPEAGEKERAS